MLLLLFSLLAAPAPPEPTFPAFMTSGDCLWQASPDAFRVAVAAATASPDLQKSAHPPLDPADWKRMIAACGLSDERWEDVGGLIFAPYSLMRGIEPRLEARWPRETLRGAFNHLSDEEIGLIWGFATGGDKTWSADEKALALAAQAKLYAPFGEAAWPAGKPTDLDLYLTCQLMIAIHAMDLKGSLAREAAGQ